jgi:hypothetical protein
MKIIEDVHIIANIKRAIALNDVIPMMVIGIKAEHEYTHG